MHDAVTVSASMLWAATAFHTALDARRRFANPSACWFWTLLGIVLPLAGAAVYLLVRPAETREERRLRRRRQLCLELAAQPRTRVANAEPQVAVPPRRAAHRPFEAQPAAR